MNRLANSHAAVLMAVAFGTTVFAQAESDETRVVPARPSAGFNYPYILRLPSNLSLDRHVLLAETNNTGAPSDDPELHLRAALELSKTGLGGHVAEELGLPMLMPVFPRPLAASHVYTHMLDRDTLEIRRGPLLRIDLQLIAMIDDAKRSLEQQGTPVDEKVLLTGFSASAKFANRFTALHPQRVRAVATGGMNGLAMLPLARLDDRTVLYPLGVADVFALTAAPFDMATWSRVPQFLFMGSEDTNDAVAFDDGYSAQERAFVYDAIGRSMLPTRWNRCRDIYAESGANATFKTFSGIGHGTNRAIRSEVAEFFRSVLDMERQEL